MAATIAQPPIIDSITLGNAGIVTKITFHKNTRTAVLSCSTSFKVARDGTDAAAVGDDALPFAATTPVSIALAARGRNLAGPVIYVAGDVNASTLKVEALEYAVVS